MNNLSETPQSWKRSLNLKRYILLLAAAWTLAMGVSLTWSFFHERGVARLAASAAARREFAKDLVYRRWNAGHGGVYVPVSESSPPNPYLAHVEEREIETPSGKRLTLMNPAYMTRQVHELGFEAGGVRGHITSLNPIRPANAPDAWEKGALETFERGEQEFSSVEVLDGQAHWRLMRPLTTEKSCLKCHGDQGYKVGDIRGGISVSVPMAPYAAIARRKTAIVGVGHGALWLLGLVALTFGTRHIQQRMRERDEAEEALRKSEERCRFLAENMADVVWTVDLDFKTTYVSPSIEKVLGFTPDERKRQTLEEMVTPESVQRVVAMLLEELQRDEEEDSDPERDVTVELEFYHAEGHTVWMENSVKAIRDDVGAIVGVYGCSRDITDRKMVEKVKSAQLRLIEYATDHTITELLQKFLDEAETLTRSKIGFYHFVDADQETLSLQTWSTSTLKNMCTAEGEGLHSPISQAGVWVDCVRERRPVIHNDYANLPRKKGLPEGHAPLIRELVVPVLRGEKIVAILGVGNKETNYDDNDVRAVEQLAVLGWETVVRRQAEEALRKAHEDLTAMLDALPDPLFEVDRDGCIYDFRAPDPNLLYCPPDVFMGKQVGDVLPEEATQTIMQAIAEAAETGLHRGATYTLKMPTGLHWFELSVSVRGSKTPEARFVVLVRDITDRKQAEDALRDSKTRLKALSEASFESIFLSEKGICLDQNQAAERMFGYTRAEALGRPGTEWISPEDRERVKDAMLSGREEPYEATALRKDGTVFPAEMQARMIDYQGRRVRVTALRDITQRKRAEEERLALERQVQHAQKLESLGVLAGGIAHDFNNLLMGILGNADLALNELSPMSAARRNLEEIEKASRRAAELAKQMLAYSGKGRFVVEPIDPNELVEEMAHLLEVSISKKAVLKYNFAENPPTFDGDVTQIRQVVMNLITNASEAVGAGSGIVALSTGAMHCERAYLDDVNEVLRAGLDEPLPEGVYTFFEVADTGCGMDAETIEKIFDPFFTTKFTGRGLGMSAVLGIVRGHKSALKIHSQLGKGTTFKVLFPANQLPDDDIAVYGSDKAEGENWRGSGTVLLADDEDVVRAVGGQMLERLGFSVLTAPDGREALKLLGEHAHDIVCVLLDLTMPHLDGEETFREMRRLHPSVRVILFSGYNEQDAIQRFAGKGLAGFIQKPFNMAALREKLMEVLGDEGTTSNGNRDTT